MKIKIKFPDDTTAVFDVEIKGKTSVEEIVDDVVEELYRRHVRAGQIIHHPERWKEAHKRWLLPRIAIAMLESLEGFKLEVE